MRSVKAQAIANRPRALPLPVWEGGLDRRVPQGAAWPLHRPGTQLGRPQSAALLVPSALTRHPQQNSYLSYAQPAERPQCEEHRRPDREGDYDGAHGGQTSGNQFEGLCRDFSTATFMKPKHLRPGDLDIQACATCGRRCD